MITAMRRVMKGKIAQTIVIIIVVSIGFGYAITSILSSRSGAKIVATVNGRSIDFTRFLTKAQHEECRIRQIRAQYGNFADILLASLGMSTDPRKTAVDQLIREELLDQLGKKLDVHITDEFLQQALVDKMFLYKEISQIIPPELIDWQASSIKYGPLKLYLNQMGLTVEDFFKQVEGLLKRSLVANLIAGSVHVPEFLVKDRFVRDYAGKDFSVLTFDFGSYLDQEKQQEVAPDKLESFFKSQNALAKRYWVPEKRTGKVWEFDHESYGVAVDQEEMKMYYDDYKRKKYVDTKPKMKVRRILISKEHEGAEQKARQLYAELVASPELFAQKAKELSDDKASASKGGLLEAFTRGTHNLAFDKAAFLLKKDGDVSNVVPTDEGFEILQRVERIPETFKSFDAVKAEIKKRLIEKKFKDQFYKDMKRALNPYTPDKAAREALLKKARNVTETKPLEKSEEKQTKTIFRTKEGSFGFYTDNDKGFVVQTTNIEKKHLPKLASIKETVLDDLYEERARKKMKHDLQKAVEQVQKSPEAFEQVKQKHNAKLRKTGTIKMNDAEKLKKLQEQELPVQAFFELEAVGAVNSWQGETDGYLFTLESVEPFDQEAFNEKREELLKTLKEEVTQLQFSSLIAFLHRAASIKVNEDTLKLGR